MIDHKTKRLGNMQSACGQLFVDYVGGTFLVLSFPRTFVHKVQKNVQSDSVAKKRKMLNLFTFSLLEISVLLCKSSLKVNTSLLQLVMNSSPFYFGLHSSS